MKLAELEGRPRRIGISVKLTLQEHEALKDLVWAEGHSSFQSYFRSLAVQKIKAAQGQARGADDDDTAA